MHRTHITPMQTCAGQGSTNCACSTDLPGRRGNRPARASRKWPLTLPDRVPSPSQTRQTSACTTSCTVRETPSEATVPAHTYRKQGHKTQQLYKPCKNGFWSYRPINIGGFTNVTRGTFLQAPLYLPSESRMQQSQ